MFSKAVYIVNNDTVTDFFSADTMTSVPVVQTDSAQNKNGENRTQNTQTSVIADNSNQVSTTEQNTGLMVLILVIIFIVIIILVSVYLRLNTQLKSKSVSQQDNQRKKKKLESTEEKFDNTVDSESNPEKENKLKGNISETKLSESDVSDNECSQDIQKLGTPNSVKKCIKGFLERTKEE